MQTRVAPLRASARNSSGLRLSAPLASLLLADWLRAALRSAQRGGTSVSRQERGGGR